MADTKFGNTAAKIDSFVDVAVLVALVLSFLGKSGGQGVNGLQALLQHRSGSGSVTTTSTDKKDGKTTTISSPPESEKTKGGAFSLEDERALLALLAIAYQEGSGRGNTIEAKESHIWFSKFMEFLRVKHPHYGDQLRVVLTGIENHPAEVNVNGKVFSKIYRYETGDIRRSAINMIAWHARENVTGTSKDDFTTTLEWLMALGAIKKTLAEIGTEKLEQFFLSKEGQEFQQWLNKETKRAKEDVKTLQKIVAGMIIAIFVLLIIGAFIPQKTSTTITTQNSIQTHQ